MSEPGQLWKGEFPGSGTCFQTDLQTLTDGYGRIRGVLSNVRIGDSSQRPFPH